MANLPTTTEGDAVFRGVDLRTHPAELAAGVLAGATNLRLTNGQAKPRGGLRFVQPPEPPPFGGLRGKAPFYHAGLYRPVSGAERIVLLAASEAVLFDPMTGKVETDPFWRYPAGQNLVAGQPVDWVQAASDTLTLESAFVFRGAGNKTLRFNYDEAFTAMDEYDTGSVTGTQSGKMVSGDFGLYYQDRLAVATGPQQVSVSDFLDFEAWSALTQFGINIGGGDYLIGAMAYDADKVLIVLRKSLYLAYFSPTAGLAGYTGSLDAEKSWVRKLPVDFGGVSRRCMLMLDGFVIILSDAGLMKLSITLDMNLTVSSERLSDPISTIFDRLSANYADAACAVALRERVYFAVPIQGDGVRVASVQVIPGAGSNVAGLVCVEDPGVNPGDEVVLSGLTGGLAPLNGLQTIYTGADTLLTIKTGIPVTATAQQAGVWLEPIQRRPNRILVFNTVNKAWESVDELPGDLRADWLLTAQSGGRRELWVVDKFYGPARYESGTQDMDGTYPSTGWPVLPQTLPFTLTSPHYNGEGVQATLRTRTYTKGDVTKALRLRQGRARFRLAAGDAAVVRVVARTPADETISTSLDVAAGEADDTVRIPVGCRVVESYAEVDFTAGAPALEMVTMESVGEDPPQARS